MPLIKQSGTVLELATCADRERFKEASEQIFELVPGLEAVQRELRDRFPELSPEASARILGLATARNRQG